MGEDVVVCAPDANEQSVIDAHQHPQRRTALAIDQRQQFPRRFVVLLSARSNVGQQRPLVGGGRRAWLPVQQRIERDVVRGQILKRQIDAVALRILGYIAQNVGELKCDAGFFRELFSGRIGVAEDANADQAHDGCDQIAVAIEIVEGRVGVGLVCGGVLQIHGGSGDKFVEQAERNPEAGNRIFGRDEDGVAGRRAMADRVPFRSPRIELARRSSRERLSSSARSSALRM